ncbi:MAG TPA: hypothetical protein VNM14_00120 [Planctomycetota bacterium]|nr:hypothetical protein [Planctomycetota bacterium]
MGPRNRLLIGQIALDLQLLDRTQLQQCIDHQAGQVSPKPLGALLVETGFLSPEKLTLVLEEQKRRLQEQLPYAPTQVGAIAFGRLVVERGYAKQEAVNEALRAQQDLADRGVRKRLGELLVDAGHLSADVMPEILKVQGKVLMACTFCGAHFNVLISIAEGYPCRKCGMPLDQKTGIVSADETAYLLPAMDPRPPVKAAAPRPAEAPSSTSAGPSPEDALRAEVLKRFARIATIIGILTLILYLITRNWD